ncbi:DNA mismatch endonuclease Vsr [Caballeronia sp. GAWG1-5s-s]|uniref:very short patch repair endonuclease n=1 Tax=Caballeronia sp. GAWG1-5s-s TaxID=2921743 RepID=UPI0025426780|nr:DNA mismatch endonuclease Vsr [Caballeronia sp. GAWG1-5s-s]
MDSLSPTERSERMGRIRATDSKPELIVRKLVFSMDFRYRLHGRKLPGRPDLVFPGRKKVIFVHGCFWHRHTECALARLPKSRLDFWGPKLEGNRLRDQRVLHELDAMGWRSLVVWECELKDKGALSTRIREFLEERRTTK